MMGTLVVKRLIWYDVMFIFHKLTLRSGSKNWKPHRKRKINLRWIWEKTENESNVFWNNFLVLKFFVAFCEISMLNCLVHIGFQLTSNSVWRTKSFQFRSYVCFIEFILICGVRLAAFYRSFPWRQVSIYVLWLVVSFL